MKKIIFIFSFIIILSIIQVLIYPFFKLESILNHLCAEAIFHLFNFFILYFFFVAKRLDDKIIDNRILYSFNKNGIQGFYLDCYTTNKKLGIEQAYIEFWNNKFSRIQLPIIQNYSLNEFSHLSRSINRENTENSVIDLMMSKNILKFVMKTYEGKEIIRPIYNPLLCQIEALDKILLSYDKKWLQFLQKFKIIELFLKCYEAILMKIKYFKVYRIIKKDKYFDIKL